MELTEVKKNSNKYNDIVRASLTKVENDGGLYQVKIDGDDKIYNIVERLPDARLISNLDAKRKIGTVLGLLDSNEEIKEGSDNRFFVVCNLMDV